MRKNLDNTMKLSRSFDWHNATQFFGALNDNVLRWLIVFFLIGIFGPDKSANVTSMTGIIFVVPFLLFTPWAGVLADRFSKRNIIVITKFVELVLMILGTIMFARGSVVGIYIVLFLMCAQSAFFGPCKYGIIPELVHREQISKANSFIEGLTYLSIVVGTAFAPWLAEAIGRNFTLASLSCIALAMIGFITSTQIEKTPVQSDSTEKQELFFKDIWVTLKQIKGDKDLILAMLASAYFMLLGGFSQMNMIPYGGQVCNYSDTQRGYLFLMAAVGIGLGSWLAGKLSGKTVEFGIVPIGAIMMAVTLIWLGLMPSQASVVADMTAEQTFHPYWGIFTLVFLMGIGCGLFIVPLHAFVQIRSPKEIRGKVLAVSSFLGWVGVLLAGLVVRVFSGMWGVPASWMFFGFGILTLALAIFSVVILPDFLIRLFIVVLTKCLYRIRVHGLENIPAEGPALIVSNHVSWADAVVLTATQQRRIRFLMDKQIFKIKWLNWLFRLARVIPISATDSPKKLVAALREARGALDNGELVCIFAEGALTRNGMLQKFRGGFEKITKGTEYKIGPTYIGGLWCSVLSHYYGELLSTWPKRLNCKVGVHFGEPMPANSSSEDLRLAISELSTDYFNGRKEDRISLGESFVKVARKNWSRACVSDTTGKRLTYGQTLIGAIALRKKLDLLTKGQQRVGIFLPPSVGAAVSNLAVALQNKVAVNLSYTASQNDRQHMVNQCGLRTVITSRTFLERLDLSEHTLPGAVYIEDLIQSITDKDKRNAFIAARLLPKRFIANAWHFDPDDTAYILYSSGSSGQPKGVMLTHHNIQSNIESALQVFKVNHGDGLCGVLPFFHSFGLTCTFWLPLLNGIATSYVPNPLDGKLVGQTVKQEKSTLFFATPTFLLNYLRRCEKDDFQSLRFMIVGAEKLKPKLIEAFDKKFGIHVREGYGATELSPLASINVEDVEVSGLTQVGTKDGTIGHPLPGLAVKVLDIETGQKVSCGQSGLMWIKGPNLMKGYLDMPEKTAEVIKDGWYNTGDIVTVDEDGFITITDRLSRFSKIGGEMVPHMTIEDFLLNQLKGEHRCLAVTAIPDEKKGEQLVILYEKDAADTETLFKMLTDSDLPRLYIPKRDNIIGIEQIPYLGSGKLDLMKLRETAKEALNM